MNTNTITKSMFESIRDALASSDDKSASTNILRTEPGNTYTVRILPYSVDPKNTFFHYFQHGWNSFATGQYVSALSPQTFDERDPIAEYRYKLYRGNDVDQANASKILRSEKWLVNVYVVNDPVTPDNNGKVMVLRYGKQLHKVITSAINGEDSADLGARVFDLSPEGVNFKIIVDKQGEYPTYVSSKFSFPTEIKGLEESKFADIYKSATELATIFKFKSYDELKQMVSEHILCKDADSERSESLPGQLTANTTAADIMNKPAVVTEQAKPVTVSDDAEIQDLLAGLDL